MSSIRALMVLAIVVCSGPVAAAPLVDAAWLRANLGQPGLVILDVRGAAAGADRETYKAAHIPGAVYSDYGRDGWRTIRDGVPGMLPPVDALERLIGGLGIGNSHHVVVVAGGVSAVDMASATRIYWTFKVLGHDAVSILDGGHRAYVRDSTAPLETGAATPSRRKFVAVPRWELVAARAAVEAALADPTRTGPTVGLADLRPPAFYRGEVKSAVVARAGTIPGAVNLPESSLLAPDGRFVSAEAAGALLRVAGLAHQDSIIAFCNSGHWASLGWFLGSEVLGLKQTRLYDGSMADWASQRRLPVVPGGN